MASRHASRLKRLIEERDPELVPTIVHLARSLEDPQVVDELLEGASFEKRRRSSPRFLPGSISQMFLRLAAVGTARK